MYRDLLADNSAWLARQDTRFKSREVKYSRLSSSVTCRATPGRSSFDVIDASGMSVRAETTDWIIHVDDLRLDGMPIHPQRGDRISDGDDYEYEVGPPVDGADDWRYTDQYKQQYRIHVKLVEDTSAQAEA